LGSMGSTCLQNNRDLLRFQAKSFKDQNVLYACPPIPLAPRSVLRSMPLSSAPSSSTLISKRRESGSPQGIA
jgi:hypothetical protein